MNRIIKLLRIAKWIFSKDRTILKTYMRDIENLKPMSESDWIRFKEVAKAKQIVFSQ